MADVDDKIKQLSDIRYLFLYSIVSALALVVGLFWNDAIKSTIEQIVPQGDSLFYKYLAAIIVSLVVVTFVYIIMRMQRLAEKRLEELKNKAALKKVPIR